jgi:aspartyl-tRNA(Asn)/glutamyl-tRNA(Gln) amidotransferase subunit C
MTISKQEVTHIASLARLEVGDEKLELFAEQFNKILEYMDTLNALETTDAEPLYSPVDHSTVLREDTAHQEFDRQEILSNAPEEDGNFFIVPKVI